MQKDLKQIDGTGTQLVGVSYDSVEILKKFADDNQISYPLLSDADSATIKAYHIRNDAVRSGSAQDGVPHPATFVVDQSGVIQAKLPGTVRRRHPTSALIDAVKNSE